MVGQGMELGLSIRGGVEHELGIYVTAVDPGSVAHAYGIKVRRRIPTNSWDANVCLH